MSSSHDERERSAGAPRATISACTRIAARCLQPLRWCWLLFIRNRAAIAIASLVWLIWRSGTQPRRLGYPCQQAAAANLGFLTVLFIPGLARLKAARRTTARHRAIALATGTVCMAGLLSLLISGGGPCGGFNGFY